MSKIEGAIHEIHAMDAMASEDKWINKLHPLVKLLVTFIYIFIVVSFDSTDINGLLSMILYPVLIFITAELDLKMCLKRLRIVLPLVCLVGLFNPFFDREILFYAGSVGITRGMITMVTLIIKGVFTVLAAYILIASSKIEDICRALRMLHVPKIFVTLILLIYRYVTLFLQEVNRMTQAYALRAPDQKGISYKAWGSLAGLILLRSMDRASAVYESMCLRGFDGEFKRENSPKLCGNDWSYLISLSALILFLRYVHLFELVGSMIMQ